VGEAPREAEPAAGVAHRTVEITVYDKALRAFTTREVEPTQELGGKSAFTRNSWNGCRRQYRKQAREPHGSLGKLGGNAKDSLICSPSSRALSKPPHLATRLVVDAAYLGQKLLAAAQQLIPNRGLRIQVVKRSDLHRHSFKILSRRWVLERTFAWLSFSRRLTKDYEVKTDHSRAFIFIAFSRIMLKRLTRYFLDSLLDRRFDVLVQAEEVIRVVFLLDGHKPVVVWTERRSDRVFSLLTQEVQQVTTARKRT
jgi:transposase